MPAKDDSHDIVVRALIKDGWTILREQYPIRVGSKRVWIDLSAEKETLSQVAFIEVKDFQDGMSIEALRDVVGQYVLYRSAMKYAGLEQIPLFLAIPKLAHGAIFSAEIGKMVIKEVGINLLVFDPVEEVIEQWLLYKK